MALGLAYKRHSISTEPGPLLLSRRPWRGSGQAHQASHPGGLWDSGLTSILFGSMGLPVTKDLLCFFLPRKRSTASSLSGQSQEGHQSTRGPTVLVVPSLYLLGTSPHLLSLCFSLLPGQIFSLSTNPISLSFHFPC